MKKVILTKGLPASGKTTWAMDVIKKNPGVYKRVNKNDLRSMLDNGKWSKANENFVLNLRDRIILDSLDAGKHVIVDDTNLHPKHEIHIEELVKGKATVEIKDFTHHVPLEVCIKRDLSRSNSVGSKVIEDMYNNFLKPRVPVYVHSQDLDAAIICDIDGTLAHMETRQPFDWARVKEDVLDEEVCVILALFKQKGVKIILLSGRDSVCRGSTVQWLIDNQVWYNELYMRKEGDQRKDTIVKKELFDKHINNKYDVRFVLDDRNCVVDMWRNELGLKCFQVAEGNFW